MTVFSLTGQKKRIRAGVGCLLLLFVWSVHAQDPRKNESNLDSGPAAESGESQWTKARMRRAVPAIPPMIELERSIGKADEDLIIREEIDLDAYDPSDSGAAKGIPARADVSRLPYSTAGKLFFNQKGIDKYCTAAFVGSTSVLSTAAHCVRDRATGEWSKDVFFVRAYSGGSGKQSLRTLCLSTKAGWVIDKSNPYKWDYAFIKTDGVSTGGYLGVRLNLPNPAWEAVGYSVSSSHLGGEYLMKVSGSKGDEEMIRKYSIAEMLGNPLVGGSSGGFWLSSNNRTVGLNSHKYSGKPDVMYGPLFDNEVLVLANYALKGCK